MLGTWIYRGARKYAVTMVNLEISTGNQNLAVLSSLWKLRNGVVFNGVVWLSLNQVWLLILRTLGNWRLIYKEHMMEQIDQFYVHVQTLLRSVARLKWGDEDS